MGVVRTVIFNLADYALSQLCLQLAVFPSRCTITASDAFFFLQEPSMKREDRMLGWPCCPSGQLYAKARIDRLAYCPGQEVKISGNISNESGKQVLGTEVQLVQRVLFKAPQSK